VRWEAKNVRIGIALLPEQDWAAAAERWKRVEEYGFDHGWLLDHLAWRSLADSPWFATVPILAGAALSTSSLRLGTIVTTPNFRHPVPLAKELMTLDMMSGGRLTIGLGAGAPGHDARMLGQADLSPRQSSARFHEFVTLLDLLLRQRRTTWRGEWFAAVEARTIPGPVQQPRPPFVVAANGPRGMALALTSAEGWVTLGSADREASAQDWWSGVGESVRGFERAVLEVGQPAASFARVLYMASRLSETTSVEQFRDGVGRAAALGFTDMVTAWPRRDEPFAGDERILDDIAAELDSLRREGY
jgi:alkanesulfonate monooxygenase SsuD/methylene tetrahydromethanopterin reductase-like flavin-dependent oxidoreductase (luciferase family)